MISRISVLLMVFALVGLLHGQTDGPVKMTPEFPLTFPLTANGDDVMVKYPVLVNPSTVVKPGMILRTIYIVNYRIEGSSDLTVAHMGNMEQSYSRTTSGPDDKDKMPPELAHEIEGYRRTVWQVPNNFVLAMAQYPTETMHMIYQPTSDNRKLADTRFSFFDGLFVGLPNGKVTVLAVESDSKSDRAGIKAGDEIVSIGGASTNNDLSTFAAAYARAKSTAKENGDASYPVVIRSPGQSSRKVDVPMPATFKSNFLNGL